jgi:MOSC domain-containing protein YiiM
MNVERIYTSSQPGGPQVEQELIRVVAGSGIEGDRYFDRHDEPGQNLTLIEIEEVEAFLSEQGRHADLSITHRNILTRGVRLNNLVGVEFWVGEVKLRGVELCEPCLGMGTALSSPSISPAGVVKRFLHRGGLRADVLSSGAIQRGTAVALPPSPFIAGTLSGLRPVITTHVKR